MHQKAPVPKRTLGQKTEDRLMKFILVSRSELERRFLMNMS